MTDGKKETEFNPMQFFVGGANPQKPVRTKRKTSSISVPRSIMQFERKLTAAINDVCGLANLRDFLTEQKGLRLLQESRKLAKLPPCPLYHTVVLHGTGDKEAAMTHLLNFYKTAEMGYRNKVHILNCNDLPDYWQDNVRYKISAEIEKGENGYLVIDHIGDLLDGIQDNAFYALDILAQCLRKLQKTHIIIRASRRDMMRWQDTSSAVHALHPRYIDCAPYTAGDLTRQFISLARHDGFIVTPIIARRIGDVFTRMMDSPTGAVTHAVAEKVYKICRSKQFARLRQIPMQDRSPSRLRAFRTQDLVRMVIPHGDGVIAL